MKLLERMPQLWLYSILVIACLASSVIGVAWAAHDNCPNEGQRGGAVATAMALFIVFSRPDYGVAFYKDRSGAIPEDWPASEKLLKKVQLIESMLFTNSKGQTLQNYLLAIATGLSTIFWGFGDVFAKWLIHSPITCT